ncbi:hypothetical protein Tco_0227310 [Tanacetum coccineum]
MCLFRRYSHLLTCFSLALSGFGWVRCLRRWRGGWSGSWRDWDEGDFREIGWGDWSYYLFGAIFDEDGGGGDVLELDRAIVWKLEMERGETDIQEKKQKESQNQARNGKDKVEGLLTQQHTLFYLYNDAKLARPRAETSTIIELFVKPLRLSSF